MDRTLFEAVVNRHAPEAFTFYDDPVAIGKGDLERVLDDLRREARRIPSLMSLYMDPGADDLGPGLVQIIGVYDASKCEPGSVKTHDILRTVGTRNILESDLLAMDVKLLEALAKFDCLLQPVHVAGQKITQQVFPVNEMRFFYLSRLLDLFSTGWLEPFIDIGAHRRVSTRAAFTALRRLCRVIEATKVIVRRDQEGVAEWDVFAERVQRLRRVWFDCGIERYKGLMPLMSEALCIVFDVIGVLDAYCNKARVVNLTLDDSAQPPQALLVTDHATTAYVADWTPERGLELSLLCSQAMERFVSVLPISFSLQLYEYGKGKGKFPTFSRFVQSAFGTDGVSGNMERSYVSWERGEMVDRMQNFLNRVGAPSDFGYTFACNIRSGSAISAAASLMNSHRNTSRLKSDMKALKEIIATYQPGKPLSPVSAG